MATFLEQLRKKDKKAVQLIYDCYGKKMYGFAVSKWKLEEDEAWDLVYMTLYKTISVIDRYTFSEEKKFTAFLYTVFANNLRNFYHKKKQTLYQQVELKDDTASVDEESKDPEPAKASIHMICLEKGLSGMEDWKRVVLLMRAQDHSYEEIANYVKRPAEQLKVYYMRLKKLLTEKINECIKQNGK